MFSEDYKRDNEMVNPSKEFLDNLKEGRLLNNDTIDTKENPKYYMAQFNYKNSNISVDEVKGKYESDMDSNNYVYYMMQAVK